MLRAAAFSCFLLPACRPLYHPTMFCIFQLGRFQIFPSCLPYTAFPGFTCVPSLAHTCLPNNMLPALQTYPHSGCHLVDTCDILFSLPQTTRCGYACCPHTMPSIPHGCDGYFLYPVPYAFPPPLLCAFSQAVFVLPNFVSLYSLPKRTKFPSDFIFFVFVHCCNFICVILVLVLHCCYFFSDRVCIVHCYLPTVFFSLLLYNHPLLLYAHSLSLNVAVCRFGLVVDGVTLFCILYTPKRAPFALWDLLHAFRLNACRFACDAPSPPYIPYLPIPGRPGVFAF